jgi:hypothetical protein
MTNPAGAPGRRVSEASQLLFPGQAWSGRNIGNAPPESGWPPEVNMNAVSDQAARLHNHADIIT